MQTYHTFADMQTISHFNMHTKLLYLLVSLLSYNHLQSSTLTQAKTFSHGFTLDLIHRYSPKSPFYNSSMTLQERYQNLAVHSFIRHRHFNNLESSDLETTLIPNNGDYLVKITIGIPPVDLYAIADTTSDLIWVQCKPCYNCNQQSDQMFDPSQSSSYEAIPCDSPFCPRIPQMECDSFTNECQYWYTYGNGSSLTSGVMAKDIFTLGSIKSTIIFGCSIQEDQGFNTNAAGFIGLSAGRYSLISQLGTPNTFSYCLTPINSTFTSKLRLGSNDITQQGTLTIPLMTRYLPRFYVITLKGISVGQRRLFLDREIYIDTSSTLSYMDPALCLGLEQAVKEVVGIDPLSEPRQPGLSLCYDKKSGISTEQPNIVLYFEGGVIELSFMNMFIDLGDAVCLAIVASEEDGDAMILGNVAQVNFEVEYDLDREVVSFTPKNCAE